MKIFAIGTGIASPSDLPTQATVLQSKPSFRKASLNMKLAFFAMNAALKEAGLDSSQLESAGFVLGSSYGELVQTKEFLKAWAKEKLARPLLFQSSLHNGTLGFLSLEFGLRGPSFTVSHQYLTGEKALELGMDLIADQAAEICFISAVEVMDPDLLPSLQCKMPEGVQWVDGAACLILASEVWVIRNQPELAFEINRLEYHQSSGSFSGSYYDSDGLEKIIMAMKAAKKNTKDETHEAKFLKRDGFESKIEWRCS